MKNRTCINLMVILVTALTVTGSCKKDDEKYPHFESPDWTVDEGNYPVNMTAVLDLPAYIKPYFGKDDKLAAFVDGTCRGVGTIVDSCFYIVIKGTSEEQSEVTFQYYNARNRYLYIARDYIGFEANLILGTSDEPEILPLTIKR